MISTSLIWIITLFVSNCSLNVGFSQNVRPRQVSQDIAGCSNRLIIGASSTSSSNELCRASFLRDAVAFLCIAAPPANAADTDVAKKGTKEDPKFQACLGLCMYDCTKAKGMEQKSRAECLPECKQKCATTKQQLLLGSPKA
mmetsp:Transcript_14487/g.20725  ORF Transcript_14487/g.20725 Transcript_14487/m.20725 type:complete len:142 (-) Transcript_14487:88-513(-)